MRRRSPHIALSGALAVGVLAYGAITFAQEMGITGLTRKNPDAQQRGCTCHGANPTSSVLVSILGPDTLLVGQTADYALSIRGGPAIKGGTNIAASGGTLATKNSTLQIFQSELTHTAPQFFDDGEASFPFSYTAPVSPGVQTLYANGNSTNGSGTSIGDAWNFAPDKLVVIRPSITSVEAPRTEIPQTFALYQNYPNPFNPVTSFQFRVTSFGFVQLTVYNLLGNEVATVLNETLAPGVHTVQWNAGDLPSGVYLYQLRAGRFSETKKMLLMK